MFFDYKSQGIPSQYSTAHVLKASLTNLLAPYHRNTYQIKLLYLYSQNKDIPSPFVCKLHGDLLVPSTSYGGSEYLLFCEYKYKSLIFISFILNFLFTVAPSTKGGCFQGAVEKPNYNVTRKRIFTILN